MFSAATCALEPGKRRNEPRLGMARRCFGSSAELRRWPREDEDEDAGKLVDPVPSHEMIHTQHSSCFSHLDLLSY